MVEQKQKAQMKTILPETTSEISKIPLAGKIVIENGNQVYLLADGFESDLLQIRPGMSVEVHTLTQPEYQTQGVVDWVSNGLDPMSHTAKIRCRLLDSKRFLTPEMYVTAFVKGTTGVVGKNPLLPPQGLQPEMTVVSKEAVSLLAVD